MTNSRKPKAALARRIPAALVLLIFVYGPRAPAQTTFTDVTSAAGFSFAGESWGASWGDFNGDGKPDLAVVNQGNPSLYDDRTGTYTYTNGNLTSLTTP